MEIIRKKDIGSDAAKVELVIKELMEKLYPEIRYENLADEILIDIDFSEVPVFKSMLRTEYMYL